MPRFEETRYPHPTAFEGQNLFPRLRKFWIYIKSSKIFQAFKHSKLNPYHFNLQKVMADTPEQEQEIARAKNISQYIDKKGIRCNVNFNGTVDEEYKKTGKVLRGRAGDISQRIPRDKVGNLDLMAEEPILFAIVPFEGISPTGHVGMQYKDRVINRVLDEINMEPLYPRYQHTSDYYLVYPSQIGINPEVLIREIDKHNIKYGKKKYNLLSNNCAKNVATVLRNAGVKDIDFLGPDKLKMAFPTPGNNPFNFGIENWCLKHGVPVKQKEVSLLYKYNEISNLPQKVDEFSEIRTRYHKYRQRAHLTQKINKLQQTLERRIKQCSKESNKKTSLRTNVNIIRDSSRGY